MMKADTTLKSIFIRTGCMFLVFYFVMMIIFTAIFLKKEITQSLSNFIGMSNLLESQIIKDIYEYTYWDEINIKGNFKKNKNNLKSQLNIDLSFFSDGYTHAFLYDNTNKLISKSGVYVKIVTGQKEDGTFEKGKTKYIDLEKCFDKQQLIEFYKLFVIGNKNEDISYDIRGNGYTEGNEIIPEHLDIVETVSGEEYIGGSVEHLKKTYDFNVEKKIDSEKLEFSEFLNIYAPYENELVDKKNDYEEIINRYEYTNDSDRNFNDIRLDKSIKINKVRYKMYKYIYINDQKYKLGIYTDYYLWDNVVSTLILVYIFSFIVIIFLIIVLSKGLYKTYEKQIKLEKNRRELTSAIAHELKTPLGIIKAYSESIKENISERKKDYYLDVIIDETDKMDKLVLEMLDLSKLESRAYELKKEAFCINELFSKILKKNEKILNDKKMKINYKSDEIYEIEGDYFRLEQVIDNLLSNAMNHAKEKINITIENRVVSIENDGEHINEDKINLIWDMFYKEDESRERIERRSGIGLAIVKNILELHNMEFGAFNTDFGVKFWFKI